LANPEFSILIQDKVNRDQQCNRLRDALQPPTWNAVIRLYDATGNVIETHEHADEFREP